MLALAAVLAAALPAGSGAPVAAGARPVPDRPVFARPSVRLGAPGTTQAVGARGIPAAYLRLYRRAASEYGLDWTVLAAVGAIESDHGRSPQAGVRAGTNAAGAAGPAQFLRTTWARYGVDVHGNGNPSPYDPADAITAMAAYLKASGAPEDTRGALLAYNHSAAYADAVLALSRQLAR